jgi:DNA polymerase II large subunit
MNHSKNMQKYFDAIDKEVKNAHHVSSVARKKGYDPEEEVNIPLAKGISERVEGLISAVSPKILNSGVAQRILELEKKYGSLDWRVALKISEEVAKEKFYKFETKLKALETGIRVGLAYITLGVISAPLEGFIELKIKKRKDGKEYFSVFFAGPIRAAGGTAEAVSIIIADFVRHTTGYYKYDPTEKEIKRTITEIRDYNDRVTNLQYNPSDEELLFLLQNLPVEINGDPTEEIEVSNYKDLDRVETNRIRGGICLVIAEGLAQKAKKVNKRMSKWGLEMGLQWEFISQFLEIQKKAKAKGQKSKDKEKISPNYTFISDIVAGRPVLSYPMRYGGFRLRYGRTRTTGLAAAAVHPQTMNITNEFVATGTQLKIERPGKAAAIVPCDSIDGPIIKLKNGTVIKADDESKIDNNNVDKILFLGDILFNYGDFSENGHKLVPMGYNQEWWIRHFEKAIINLFGFLDLYKASELLDVSSTNLEHLFLDSIHTKITFRLARKISELFKIPLHSDFIYYWTNITKEELYKLRNWIKSGKIKKEESKIVKIILENNSNKEILEKIGLPHLLVNKEYVVIEKEDAHNLHYTFIEKDDEKSYHDNQGVLNILSKILKIEVKDKAGTFIGTRMGRPEKAKMRKLQGSPHFLFPVGEEGGRLKCIQSALDQGKITADFPVFYCQKCKKETIFIKCLDCNNKTTKSYFNYITKNISTKEDPKSKEFRKREIDIKSYFKTALSNSGLSIFPDLIKGVKKTSNKTHITEPIIKGILRAKHGIFVNKDGTTRYDMIELPITHFKPKEIGTSIEKLIELGYTYDTKGRKLENINQVLELKPQDQILPASLETSDEPADEVLFRIANFIDELLIRLYKLPPYYNLKSKKDIIGHLVIGLAPHTSAGTIGRIIGFTKTQGMFSHPLFHAAMRRNCDGDEACVVLLMDAFLNFSRSFLPDRRGSRTMDAPLVLTSVLVPGEVDDEVHGMDIVWSYPLELYESAALYKNPWDVEVKQISQTLDTYEQYEEMGYTHEISDINKGVRCSAYKTLPTMQDKLFGQMDLAEKIVAVEPSDVAELVINRHFLKDIKGNLRKFSRQQFRCVKCNEKYRRPPLRGKCIECNGKIIFTISEGSIIKYLKPTISLAEKYKVSKYLTQSIEILRQQVESVLGRDSERQEGLGKWFG